MVSDGPYKNWNEGEDRLWEYTIEVNPKIEPLFFTEEDFKDNIDPIILKIKKEGILVD